MPRFGLSLCPRSVRGIGGAIAVSGLRPSVPARCLGPLGSPPGVPSSNPAGPCLGALPGRSHPSREGWGSYTCLGGRVSAVFRISAASPRDAVGYCV